MAQRKGGKVITSTSWEIIGASILAMSAGTAAVAVRLAIPGIGGGIHETLLRTRGWLTAWLDGTQVPGALTIVSVGLRLASEGSGGTVTVSPFTEGGYPWFFHESFVLGYEETVTDVIQIPALSGIRMRVDDKAMRKIRPAEELQMVVENTTIGTAANVNVAINGRWLFGR